MEFSAFLFLIYSSLFNQIQPPPNTQNFIKNFINNFINTELLVQQSDIRQKKLLSKAEISERLKSLPNWQVNNNQLTYTHKFKNFVEAINFVNCLVAPAETANHHPDIAISYNQVTINLTTHDVGGLTDQDFDMATTISQLIKTWKPDKNCQL